MFRRSHRPQKWEGNTEKLQPENMPRAVLEDEQYEVRVPQSSDFEKPQGLTKRQNKKGANTAKEAN